MLADPFARRLSWVDTVVAILWGSRVGNAAANASTISLLVAPASRSRRSRIVPTTPGELCVVSIPAANTPCVSVECSLLSAAPESQKCTPVTTTPKDLWTAAERRATSLRCVSARVQRGTTTRVSRRRHPGCALRDPAAAVPEAASSTGMARALPGDEDRDRRRDLVHLLQHRPLGQARRTGLHHSRVTRSQGVTHVAGFRCYPSPRLLTTIVSMTASPAHLTDRPRWPPALRGPLGRLPRERRKTTSGDTHTIGDHR